MTTKTKAPTQKKNTRKVQPQGLDTPDIKYLREMAELGHAWAQHNLARRYANGLDVAQDNVQAVQWYKKAADQGLAEAQCSLGVMYETVSGVSKDYGQAVEWYRKAAEQGSGAMRM